MTHPLALQVSHRSLTTEVARDMQKLATCKIRTVSPRKAAPGLVRPRNATSRVRGHHRIPDARHRVHRIAPT